MKTELKAIVASVVVVALLLTAVTSVTYSWFSDSEESEINVTTGRVDVGAETTDLKLYSNGTLQTDKFINGGSAELKNVGGKVTINVVNMTPGDSIQFKMKFTNDSTVNILWRTAVAISGDDAVVEKISISEVSGATKTALKSSDWSSAVDPETKTLREMTVEVAFSKDATNTGACKIVLGVEAVQSNADVFTVDNPVIYSKADLYRFAEFVNDGITFEGKTVTLAKDIDLSGDKWVPIGKSTVKYPGTTFKGVFDGNDKTISNFVAEDYTENHSAAGLFGTANNTIKDLTVQGAKIISSHYAGVICGYSTSSSLNISNCKVIDCTVISNPELINGGWDNGDKVGGIIGYAGEGGSISNCSVEKSTIQGYRNVAGIVGFAGNNDTIEGCVVSDVVIIQNYEHDYKGSVFDCTPYGTIFTSSYTTVTSTNNSYSNVDVKFQNLNIHTNDVRYTFLEKVIFKFSDVDYTISDGSIETSRIGGNIDRQINSENDHATIIAFNQLPTGSTLSFDNFTFTGTFDIGKSLTYNNCKFLGTFVTHYENGAAATFNKCLFEHDSFDTSGANDYPVWIKGTNGKFTVTFKECTVNAKKPMKFHADNNGEAYITFDGCSFSVPKDSTSDKNYSAGIVFQGKYKQLNVSNNTLTAGTEQLIAIYGGSIEIDNDANAFVCANNNLNSGKLISYESWHPELDSNLATKFNAWKTSHDKFEFLKN